jgi:AcrR family transcriptional regulator
MSSIELSRRERKKDETRERIVSAAIRLFMQKGFESATVDEIAAAADVAKGTFFNYFPRKEAVLDALGEQVLQEMEEVTRDLLAQPGTAPQKIHRFASEITRRHSGNRELSRVFVQRMLSNFQHPIHSAPGRIRELLRTLIEQGQAAGEIRPLDTARASAVIQGAAIGTLLAWFSLEPGAFDLEDELQERLSIILDGLTPRARERGGR